MPSKKREARFVITADNKTASAFGKITGDLKGLVGQFASFRNVAGGAFAAVVGGAAVRGITNMIQGANDLTDSLRDSSIKLGVNIGDLQAYQLAAKNAGLSAEDLDGLIVKMNKNVGEVKLGDAGDKVIEAFQRVGLSVEEIQKQNPSQVFEEVIDGLGKIEDPAIRTSTAMQLFGKSGAAALGLVADGKDSLAEAKKLLEDYGVALTAIDAGRVDQANDSLGILGTVVEAAKQKIGAGLAPAITYTAQKLLELGNSGETSLGEKVAGAAQTAINVIDRLISIAGVAKNSFEVAGDEAGAAFSSILADLSDISADVVHFVGTDIPKGFKTMLEAGEKAITGLKQGFTDFGTNTINVVLRGINAATAAIDSLVNGSAKLISGFVDQASKLPGAPKMSFSYEQHTAPVDVLPMIPVAPTDLGSKNIKPGLQDEESYLRGLGGGFRDQADHYGDLAAGDSAELMKYWGDLVSPDGGDFRKGVKAIQDQVQDLNSNLDPNGSGTGDGKGGTTGALDKVKKGAKEASHAIKDTFNILSEYGKAVTSGLEHAIDEFTKDGKINVQEFGRSILSELAAITAKAAILGSILGNQKYGGNAQGLIGPVLSSIFSGGVDVSGAPKALPAYDGGGFTGFGARSGGLDGRGGFAAVLHPNESVIDHTRSGGSGTGDTYISKTVIVRETMPASVVRQITSDAENGAVGKILNNINRGGRRAKAFTGRR